MQTSLVSNQPTWVAPHLFLSLQRHASSVLRSLLEDWERKDKEEKMHILQVPVKGLWGRKLKLMGKLRLSFISATVASISPEMREGGCAIYHCPLCVCQ